MYTYMIYVFASYICFLAENSLTVSNVYKLIYCHRHVSGRLQKIKIVLY